MSNPADLGVEDAAAALARRTLSARELVEACLTRIRERDGRHSHDGDPGSINAWVRVYEEDAAPPRPGPTNDSPPGTPAPLRDPIGLEDLSPSPGSH